VEVDNVEVDNVEVDDVQVDNGKIDESTWHVQGQPGKYKNKLTDE
jgi:hypothetical protein